MMVNYGGISTDGRVYLGRGGGTLAFDARIGPEFDRSSKQAREIEEDFRYLYPELHDVPIKHTWSGPVDRSTTGIPWFGALAEDERIHYAIGYTGHGVAASAIAGRVLAAAVLSRRDEWASLGELFARCRSGHFPAEPLRFLAGQVVRRAVGRKERAEREGRVPSSIDRALSRLAPATIIDVGRRPAGAGPSG
jgi:glycine/D-amino acid oxidase-like deaminating enzyme